MGPRSFLAAVAVFTLLLVALTLWVYPSRADFAASNPSWNGFGVASQQLGIKRIASLRFLPGEGGSTALIVIPYVSPSPSDLETIKQYVDAGGVLILMDDFGFGNAVLEGLGVGARFSGQLLVDPLFNFKNRRLPRIAEFPPGPASEGVRELILNRATMISVVEGMRVLARSTPVSFLDADENGRRDAGEEGGSFAVAAIVPVRAGSLVLVSDPSMLLNSMLDLADNRRFVENLFRVAGDGAQVYLDESHLPRAPLDVAKDGLHHLRGFLASPLVAFAISGVGLALPLVILWKSTRR